MCAEIDEATRVFVGWAAPTSVRRPKSRVVGAAHPTCYAKFKHYPETPMRRRPTLRHPLTRLSVTALLLFALTACSKEPPPAAPQAITQGTVCSLDGMTLMDYPGPKGQIHYTDGTTEFFCDTVEMFSITLRPEQQKRIRAIFTQDMAKAEWRAPRGQWIAARSAYYVRGSSQRGSMGPTLAAFAARADAQAFAQKYGGTVLAFGEVTIDMIDLHGGAEHDRRM